jgi:hypothetical protein
MGRLPTGVSAEPSGASREAAPRRLQGADGITFRAVLLSFGLIVVLVVVGFYVELAWMRVDLWGVPSLAPVLVLVALAAAGVGARRVGLTRRELLVIYAVLLSSSPLISHGMLFWMIPKVVHYYYLARAMPEWQTLFLPAIPSWFGPSQIAAVEGFFSGHARVPWDQWWLPLAVWSSFLFALMAAAGSVIALLQRQWINHERLSFPLAQIPLTLVGGPSDGRPAGRLTSDRLFWLGAGLAGAIAFLNSLAQRYPAVPSVPLGPVPIMLWQKVGPLAGLGEIDLVLWPWLIGLAFLIPAELSFSCWFFWFVRLGFTVLAITAGHQPQLPEEWWESGFPAPYNQAGGAMLALGLWALWIARHHLRGALRIAFSRSMGADAAEPLPYRWALAVLAVSLAWMVYFLCLAGCRFIFAAVLVLLILAFYVVWARLRAETGLGFLNMPFEYQLAMTMPTGSAALTPAEVVTLHTVRWAYYPGEGSSFDVCTASQLEALKIADAAGLDCRRLFLLLAVAFVFSLVVSSYLLLTGIYRYGFLSLAMGGANGQTWPAAQPKFDGDRIVNMLTTPTPPDYAGLIGIAAGAAVAISLGAMRLRFPWWPLHPLGYLASNVWGMMWFYMPFLVGWAGKVLVLRYGGLHLYRKAMPLAIGMIAGDMLNRGVWVAIAVATQGRS